MLIDCETCVVRDVECDDCVVTHLLSTPPAERAVPEVVHGPVLLGLVPSPSAVAAAHRAPVELDPAEADAIQVLADYGLVPPLRLAQGE